MKKLTLIDNDREEFLIYSKERIKNSSKDYPYITDSLLNNVFTFYIDHRLTVQENAVTYWYNNDKKEMECLGYSNYSINERDNEEGMKLNLFHEVFCKTEWLARGLKEEWFLDTCKAYFGRSFKQIIV
jgi:hypothetical protein